MVAPARLAFFILVSTTAACAVVEPASRQKAIRLERVGVVSSTGDSLYKQIVGPAIFGGQRDTEPVKNWKLDAVYEEQLAAAVRAAFKAEPIVLGGYRSEFAEVNSLKGPWEAPAFWGPNYEKVRDVSRRACQEERLDAIIVVSRWQTHGLLSSKIEGIGIYGLRDSASVYVLSKLGLVECPSGEVVTIVSLLRRNADWTQPLDRQAVSVGVDPALAAKPFSG